jgi:hypothetical protein
LPAVGGIQWDSSGQVELTEFSFMPLRPDQTKVHNGFRRGNKDNSAGYRSRDVQNTEQPVDTALDNQTSHPKHENVVPCWDIQHKVQHRAYTRDDIM